MRGDDVYQPDRARALERRIAANEKFRRRNLPVDKPRLERKQQRHDAKTGQGDADASAADKAAKAQRPARPKGVSKEHEALLEQVEARGVPKAKRALRWTQAS